MTPSPTQLLLLAAAPCLVLADSIWQAQGDMYWIDTELEGPYIIEVEREPGPDTRQLLGELEGYDVRKDELLYEIPDIAVNSEEYGDIEDEDLELLLNGGVNVDRREPGIDYSDDSQQESSVRVGQPEVTAP